MCKNRGERFSTSERAALSLPLLIKEHGG